MGSDSEMPKYAARTRRGDGAIPSHNGTGDPDKQIRSCAAAALVVPRRAGQRREAENVAGASERS